MKIIISNLSRSLNMTYYGCWKLLKRLNISTKLDDNHLLAISIKLASQLNETRTKANFLKPIYTIKCLSEKMGHDKKTITTILQKSNIQIITTKRKRYIYLASIYNLLTKPAGEET